MEPAPKKARGHAAAADAEPAPKPEPPSLEQQEAARVQADSDAVGTTSTEIFSDYRPSFPNAGCMHPGDVAEAASLAATSAPRSEYPLCPALLDGNKLSEASKTAIKTAAEKRSISCSV